jgi:hypothetical protein
MKLVQESFTIRRQLIYNLQNMVMHNYFIFIVLPGTAELKLMYHVIGFATHICDQSLLYTSI